MPTYRYEAMTSSGEEVVDVIEADNPKAARRLLSEQGLFVTKLEASAASSRSARPNKEPVPTARPVRGQPKQPEHTKRIPAIMFVFFGFFGLGATSAGAYLGWSTLSRIHGAQRVDAKVVEVVVERRLEDNEEYHYALVEYSMSGQTYRVRSSVSDRRWSVGQKMAVLVRPDHPADAVIDSFTEKWLPTLIVGGVGIAFLLFTMLTLRKRSPRACPQ